MILTSTQLLPLAKLHLAPSGLLAWSLVLALALVCAGVAWRAYTDTQPPLEATRRWILISLRSLVLLTLLFLLLEPVLFRQTSRELDPAVLVLVDDSGSMSIVEEGGRSRLERAREWAEISARALHARGNEVQVFEAEGARRLRRAGEMPDAEGTNLPSLLLSAVQQHLEDNLQAILLFSDGVSTDREQASLAGLKIPVFTVAVGDSAGPGDLRVDGLRYPGLVYRGESLEIEAEAVIDAERAGQARAILQSTTRSDTLDLAWPAGGGRLPIRFSVDADSLGIAHYELRLDELPGEALTQNNRAQIAFEVRKDRLRVVLVQSRPSWDFHFLRRRLNADPRFEVEAVYRREMGWGVAGNDSAWSPPRRVEEVADVDAWIVASLEDLAELAESAPGILRSVESGAGLFVIFGEARRASVPALSGVARSLLPVQLEQGARWVESRYRVRITAAGRGHPVLAFPSELGSPAQLLEEMPPLWEAVLEMRTKPEAEELLRVQAEEASGGLLSIGPYGRGSVACWSGSPLWSWSFWRLGNSEGEAVYDALLGNLIYFLAEGGDRARLQLVLPRPVVAQGEDAPLRAIVLDQRLQPDVASDLWLEWRASRDGALDSLAEASGRARMNLEAETPGGRRLALPALPAGRYDFRVALEEGDARQLSEWQELTVDAYSVEFQMPGVDRASLRRIARGSGGETLDPEDLDAWVARLPLLPETTVRVRRVSLWASLQLFLPFLALLSLEWILRRRWGLV